MSDANREYLRELKQQDPYTGYRIAIAQTDEFARVQFVMRGEMAFYQEGDRALFIDVLVGPAVIDARSIKRWDSGEKISVEHREAIIERVSEVLRRAGAQTVRVQR